MRKIDFSDILVILSISFFSITLVVAFPNPVVYLIALGFFCFLLVFVFATPAKLEVAHDGY